MHLIGLARVAYRLLLCKVSSQKSQSLLPSYPVVAVVQFRTLADLTLKRAAQSALSALVAATEIRSGCAYFWGYMQS
jgi:hypothetical protein